jgi:hypothetical protein
MISGVQVAVRRGIDICGTETCVLRTRGISPSAVRSYDIYFFLSTMNRPSPTAPRPSQNRGPWPCGAVCCTCGVEYTMDGGGGGAGSAGTTVVGCVDPGVLVPVGQQNVLVITQVPVRAHPRLDGSSCLQGAFTHPRSIYPRLVTDNPWIISPPPVCVNDSLVRPVPQVYTLQGGSSATQ